MNREQAKQLLPSVPVADCPVPERPWRPVINPPLQHASANIENVRQPSNDERRASWAAKYYLHGHHHETARRVVAEHQQEKAE